ncbi:MAG TPA: polysaccharide deacetylase family protein [Actinophytocola sp.]|uniref:polysaccharide deacetylase family protein n=1 Tax=Actinophytocola sp. TaxID=1872138 RepID=UPI002DBCB1D3|nr:polysaccharide deacetylase family protein [Actinophytocola sp.]HEU5472591.1 polysaccharide deacetylase family protein [Actinophytocola sp.]
MTGYVGLTFDDGPHPDSTLALLAALDDAPATFFIWGEHAERHPDLLRACHSAGKDLGNHTFTHPHLTELDDPGSVFEEIDQTQRTIRRITGQTPTLFRPPYGDTDDRVRATASRLALTEVLWTVDTRDWAGVSTSDIVRAAASLRSGDIILMHDGGYQTTVAAVPHILTALAARGLRPGRIARTPHPVAVAP